MHPGNLFVEADGTIVAVDFGITGRLGKKERRFLAEILYGFITRDYRRVAEVHFEAGYVPRSHDVATFAQAIRAIGEPIHGQPAETISMAKLLTLLFEVTELFDMADPHRTRAAAEDDGGGRRRGAHARSALQHVEDRRNRSSGTGSATISARAECSNDAREGRRRLMSLVRQAPELAARTERLSREIDVMAEHGLRFDAETAHAIGKAEARGDALGPRGAVGYRAGVDLDRLEPFMIAP